MKTTIYYTKNKEEVDKRYRKFKSLVNMSAKEMKAWKKEPCSKAASIKRLEVINRVTRLLEKPKVIWNRKDFIDSAKVISYLSRATAIKDSVKPASKLCRRGKNYYALKNWAFDRDKIRRNPRSSRPTWIDKNYSEVKNHLDWLIDKDVILKIYSGSNQGFTTYKSIYGILKKKFIYSFQFNPLNQLKYEKLIDKEKIEKIKKFSKTANLDHINEEHMMMELEQEFQNNEPTFEFRFALTDVSNIENDNEIYIATYKEFIVRELI